MSYSDLPVAVGSCIATIATLLIVVRLSSSQRHYAFMRMLRGWVRLPTSRALLILASLVAMPVAVLFWSMTHGAAYGSVASVTSYTKVPAIDASDDDTAAGANADERALDALRGYVGQLPNSAAARANQTPLPEDPKDLPDVNTMIARLAQRLESDTTDKNGWKTLGWAYLNTERYSDAVHAYETALALDPSDPELKSALDDARSKVASTTAASPASAAYARAVEPDLNSDGLKRPYDEATAKASESGNSGTASSLHDKAIDERGDGPSVETTAEAEAMPSRERDAAIRSMVDGLASRLESSPRDVEGWTRLMRSRVVLGEKDVAATAFREALEVFKDNSTASGKIAAAASELGLKSE